MLALMSQIANARALGLLVIDEIQHLSRSRSVDLRDAELFCDDGESYSRTSDAFVPWSTEFLRLICGLHVEGRVELIGIL